MSHAIGKVASLQEAVQPSSLNDREIKPVKQPYAATFALYQLPDGVAADFECDPEKAFDEFDQARVSGKTKKYGSYFASVFRLKAPKGKSDAITLVWAKDSTYWKVVSWEVEPEKAKPGAMPDTRRGQTVAAASGPEKAKLKADPGVVKTSHDFLHTWAGRRQLRRRDMFLREAMPAWCGIWRRDRSLRQHPGNMRLRFAGR
jgi:hypothetical protein